MEHMTSLPRPSQSPFQRIPNQQHRIAQRRPLVSIMMMLPLVHLLPSAVTAPTSPPVIPAFVTLCIVVIIITNIIFISLRPPPPTVIAPPSPAIVTQPSLIVFPLVVLVASGPGTRLIVARVRVMRVVGAEAFTAVAVVGIL